MTRARDVANLDGLLTAKGDIYAATAAATPASLAVGANNTVLVADSTTATGLKWAPNSGPVFSVYRTSDQTTTQNAYTKIQFNGEFFDSNNCFDSTTNYRFTPTTAGYYQLNTTVTLANLASNSYVAFYKNGTEYWQVMREMTAGTGFSGSQILYFNGSTDYAEVFVYCTGAGAGVRGISAQAGTSFSGVWIRS